MSGQEVDTERVSVRTYVPRYQRDAWDEHADELGMSRSEYVRSMVQAGRRGFLDDDDPVSVESRQTAQGEVDHGEADQMARTSGHTDAPDLETTVIERLSTEGYLSWDELLAAVTTDIEDRLEESLQSLQADDRVRYSGRNGGYTLDE